MAIEKYLDYIKHEKRYSSHTYISCKTDLDQFSVFLEKEYQLNDLTESEAFHIRTWIANLSDKGISNRTIQRKISSLRSYFKYLVKLKLIDVSPTEQLITPKINQKLPQFVEEKNMIKLFFNPSNFPDGFKSKRDKLLLKLLYYTGMRLSELIHLRPTDIDHFNGSLKVLGKRNKERIIPISSTLLEEIKTYIDLSRSEFEISEVPYLLLSDKGKKLYPKFVYRKVNHYLSLVTTLSKKSPHILRHSFATHMLNRGADLNAIKEILGHADLTATQVYTHNSISKLKNVHKLAHPKG